MAEKDATARLRRAVQENNLFLVKRLIQRIDMRNPDPGPKRYTSLAWAAVLGNEETFEYLLNLGHDDQELSRDSDNNTILIMLAEITPTRTGTYAKNDPDFMDATLRMARLYFDRYPFILDWSNSQGKTALHTAALKGNEELVRMLCDLGADVDLTDLQGNSPLHYAASWGHSLIVQLLIERGCHYAARNNEGCTPSDYAYSFYIRETLEETARTQYELNKKARKIFAQAAQAAARGQDWSSLDTLPPSKAMDIRAASVARMRSGSGGSRTTSTDDSGDLESGRSNNGQQSGSLQSQSSSQPLSSSSYLMPSSKQPSSSSTFSLVGVPSHSSSSLGIPTSAASALSPIASRMREQDASAMEKYMRRNRSGSASTEVKSQASGSGSADPSSAGPSANGDDISSLPFTGSVTPRRLRPSVSASQLRSSPKQPFVVNGSQESRHRAGTNPTLRSKPSFSPPSQRAPLPSSPSRPTHPRASFSSNSGRNLDFTGPPSAYAQFPFPESRNESDTASTPSTASTTTTRRLHFPLISKSSSSSSQQPSPQQQSNSDQRSPGIHRRGGSVQSLR